MQNPFVRLSLEPCLHPTMTDNLDGSRSSRVLDPIDRISAVLFGLLLVLTFTGTLSVLDSGRDEVRSHVRRTDGDDRVALVSTMNTPQPRSAVRETCKAQGLPEAVLSALVAILPHGWHPDPRRRATATICARRTPLRRATSMPQRLSQFQERTRPRRTAAASQSRARSIRSPQRVILPFRPATPRRRCGHRSGPGSNFAGAKSVSVQALSGRERLGFVGLCGQRFRPRVGRRRYHVSGQLG